MSNVHASSVRFTVLFPTCFVNKPACFAKMPRRWVGMRFVQACQFSLRHRPPPPLPVIVSLVPYLSAIVLAFSVNADISLCYFSQCAKYPITSSPLLEYPKTSASFPRFLSIDTICVIVYTPQTFHLQVVLDSSLLPINKHHQNDTTCCVSPTTTITSIFTFNSSPWPSLPSLSPRPHPDIITVIFIFKLLIPLPLPPHRQYNRVVDFSRCHISPRQK